MDINPAWCHNQSIRIYSPPRSTKVFADAANPSMGDSDIANEC
jgi:hypothetical protein